MREVAIIEVWRLQVLTIIANILYQWAIEPTWVRSNESIGIAIEKGH